MQKNRRMNLILNIFSSPDPLRVVVQVLHRTVRDVDQVLADVHKGSRTELIQCHGVLGVLRHGLLYSLTLFPFQAVLLRHIIVFSFSSEKPAPGTQPDRTSALRESRPGQERKGTRVFREEKHESHEEEESDEGDPHVGDGDDGM